MHRRVPAFASLLAGVVVAPAVAQSGWSTPALEAPLNSSSADTSPHLSSHGLVAHLASFRTGNWEIFSAARATRSSPWGAPSLEGALAHPSATDSDPFLTADGLSIYFASTRAGGQGSFDLLRSTRHSPTQPWAPPTFVTEVSSSSLEGAPSLTGDDLELYFLTNGLGATTTVIARAVRASTASPFGAPALVPELLSTNTHRDVHIALDGLTIHYTMQDPSSQRLVVMTARRTSTAAAFGTPVLVSELAGVGTTSGVFSFAVSAEGNEALLAAGFAVSAGAQEIMTTRFDGLTSSGIAATGSAMALHYRDGANASQVYALALALGGTGFPLGARWVPLDPDALFLTTFGTSIPTLSTGFFGVLDAGGEAVGSLQNPLAALAGATIWVGGFTLTPTAPFNVATISNSFPVELHP